MKYCLIIFSLLHVKSTFAQSNFPDFLQGTWKMENKEIYEHWDKLNENKLKGFSYKLKDGQMFISEYLDITKDKSEVIYTATVLKQNQGSGVNFNLTKADSTFTFENTGHDFPKKIVYQKLNDKEIFVQVSDGKQKGFAYKMQKQFQKAELKDSTISNQFIKEIEAQKGTWIADNSKYKDDGVDSYAIEWKLSPLKNSLYGRLYSIKDNLEIGTFWTFHKYFDPSQNKVVLMQIGYDGSLGNGTIYYKKNNETILVQTFTDPKGTTRLEGHKMTYPNDTTEIGSSYSINQSGEWILNRTYTWKKHLNLEIAKQNIKDTTIANPNYNKTLADRLGGDDYGMKSYFLVILKTGTNKTTDKELIKTSFRGHMENINRLVAEDKLTVAGPLGKNENNYRGIFILNNIKTIEEAKEILQTDLAIQNGLLDYEIFTWYGSAALPEYLSFSDKIWKLKP